MHPTFYMRVFLPVHALIKRDNSLAAYRELCKHDSMSADQLRELAEQKLRALVRHTAEHVPHYRNMFRELELEAEDISSFSDLPTLPVVTKADIRAAGDDFFAENIAREELVEDATGGSSGTPFVFYHRKQDRAVLNGNLWRADSWMGSAPGTPKARIWGCGPLSPRERLISRHISNTIVLPGHDLSDGVIASFCREMYQFRPEIIEGYGHLLWEFCRSLRRLDLRAPTTLRAAIFGAEGLGRPQRSFIEQTLGCPVKERYGSREVLAIAAECDRGSLHIASDVNWVEVVADDGQPLRPGNLGQIVITCLHSYAFPLIRYAISDVGIISPEKCPCGSPHPVLSEIGGRSGSMLILPDGTRVTGLAIAHRMRMLDRVGQVQVVQTSLDRMKVLISRGSDSRGEDIDALIKILQELTKNLVELELEFVDQIQRAPSGKYELVRSQVLSGSSRVC